VGELVDPTGFEPVFFYVRVVAGQLYFFFFFSESICLTMTIWAQKDIDFIPNISYPYLMKHKDDIYFYFAFVICLGFAIILISLGAMDSRNQKFLQEMVVNKPVLRFEF